MEGIVSLLDDEHGDVVYRLWADLEQEFGLRGIYAARFPHFSYHVADSYDMAALQPIMEQFAASHSPFLARTTGLAVFTGPQPILFIPVVRTPELTLLHQDLWLAVAGTAAGTAVLYHPHKWVPHITLAHGDLRHETLPYVIHYLSERQFTWEISIDNLAVVTQAGTAAEKRVRFGLGG